ncbi:MAG: UvrD-helicase domain-containing protein [Candidatus Eisenbacteria bacterium]|nr:UvrD-helicase domain-containing protein [Candidatus Eisenbacteria bacterium]
MPTISPTVNLNHPQREAVEHGRGPLLVLAGAGSGKTRVLTHRIAYLIHQQNVRPSQILAVTFTNKAAAEMRNRVETLIGVGITGLWIGTFHSIGLRMLRIHVREAGFKEGLTVFDTDDQRALLGRILKEENVGETRHQAREMLGRISRAKNAMQTPDQMTGGDPRAALIAHIWQRYQKELKRQNAVDFDDILIESLALLRNHPSIQDSYRRRFEHILVDEYQDTNAVQFQFVEALSGPDGNIFVVGDDDQSFYGWRGADIRNILDVERAFPKVETIRLEENYRSTSSILDVAHAVVSRNRGRKPKKLWTGRGPGEPVRFYLGHNEDDEAREILANISEVLKDGQVSPGEIVILYRTHAQSRPLEDACLARRIPYIIVGSVTFYQRREIKDLLAYLRLSLNPLDEISLRRAVGVPRRGVGEKTILRWLAEARIRGIDPVTLAAGESSPVGGRSGKALQEWAGLILKLRERRKSPPGPVIEELVDAIEYRKYLQDQNEHDVEDRLAHVDEFISGAQVYVQRSPEGTLDEYVGELSLLSQIDSAQTAASSISLMTVHNAKGLEFDQVFLSGLEEGLFPHMSAYRNEEELEEERRLFYVACTRARDRLHLSAARERRRTNRPLDRGVSQFVTQIPPDLLEFEVTDLAPAAPNPSYDRRGLYRDDDSGEAVISYDDPLVGARVSHPTFGEGCVLHVDGDGDGARVTVRFPRSGQKKIQRNFLKVL